MRYKTASTPVTVAAGAATAADLTTEAFATIRGVATDATAGAPLANVVVYASGADGSFTSDVTDAAGAYELTDLDAGAYEVILGDVLSPGHDRKTVAIAFSTVNATVNLSVDVLAVLGGHVFEADGVTPLAGGAVTLAAGSTNVLTTSSDTAGHYSFILTSGGMYDVFAGDARYRFAAIRNIDMSAGSNRQDLDFRGGNRTVEGAVRDAAGRPVAFAQVALAPRDLPTAFLGDYFPLVTGADGRYRFAGAVDGDYELIARGPSFAQARQAITVAGAPLTADFALAAGRTIEGEITDPGAGPLANSATIELIQEGDPTVHFSTSTAANGRYRFDELPAGLYALAFRADGRQTLVLEHVDLATVPAHFLSVGLAAPGATVTGAVTAAGEAAAGAAVLARLERTVARERHYRGRWRIFVLHAAARCGCARRRLVGLLARGAH